MTLAVREKEAGTSKSLTHHAKLEAVDFGTEEPMYANLSEKSATSILVDLRKHSHGDSFLSAPHNRKRFNDRLCARSVPADGAVAEMILRRRAICPTEHKVDELSS